MDRAELLRLALEIQDREFGRQGRLNALDPDENGDLSGDTYPAYDEAKADVNEDRADDLSKLLAVILAPGDER